MLKPIVNLHKEKLVESEEHQDATINMIRTFWNDNFTVSNIQTSHPGECSATLFDNNPLLSHVNLIGWNIELHTTKRNEKEYYHQYHVQNGTDEKLCMANF